VDRQGGDTGVPDRALVAGLRGGDRDAGDLLVARYYGRVLAYMLRETRNAEMALDLTQDVFELAVRHLRHLRDDDFFAGWLHAIARRRLGAERRARPAWRLLPLDAAHERPMPSPAGEGAPVQEALDVLGAADRQLLVQHILWGMAPAEIAASHGAAVGAVYQRLARAKGRLRDRIKQLEAEERGAE